MADRYQKVYVKLWTGDTFRPLSQRGRMLWLYLLTCPETTMIPGVVPTSLGLMADRLGWTTDEVRETLGELEVNGDAAFDPAGLVWLPRGIDHNPPDSSKNVKGWSRHWSEVPSCPLKLAAWTSLRSWLAMNKGEVTALSFEETCKRPVISTRKTPGQMPHAMPHPMPHREGHPMPHAMPHPMPVAVAGTEAGTENRESAATGARAGSLACEESPVTSPSGRVLATVVSTEPPPSRQPPPPVEVAPSSPRTETPPSCPVVAPLAAPLAEDDDQPPPAQRCPSTPRPEPVAVETAPVAPASPVAAPSGQTSLLTTDTDEPEPVAIPKVSQLAPTTPANRILRAWGEVMFQSHHQPLATESRRRAVRDRLKTFTEDDLHRALRSAITDPYVNGRSDRAPSGGQRDIAWLFAKVERVEGFLRNAPSPVVATPTPPRPIRLPPPPKPGEVRTTITREQFERSAFASLNPPRRTPAEVDALLGLEAHHAS